MKIKINSLNHLNNILFYGGFGKCEDLVVLLNNKTLQKLTDNFKTYSSIFSNISPEYFLQYNGVKMALAEWLEDGEVDIKI